MVHTRYDIYLACYTVMLYNGLLSPCNALSTDDLSPQQVLYLVSTTAECFLSRKYGLRVGAPYGGVCLPKDVPELTSLAPEGSVFRDFLSGTGKINEWIANTPKLKVKHSVRALGFSAGGVFTIYVYMLLR